VPRYSFLQMGAHWIRVFLPWLDTEQSPGERNWDKEYDLIGQVYRQLGASLGGRDEP
jgi:hypothetical protein